MHLRSLLLCAALCLLAPAEVVAGPAQFDLSGPTLQVEVTHAGATLPISRVPNLSAGDQLWIKPELPKSEAVHYLLVAAFLRGATNPPPKSWFFRAETWTDKGRDGLKITVPKDAEEAIVFLAPQAGGDFNTLINAVRGRPGAFVRSSQDLNQAALDRSRLDAYLEAVRKPDSSDPDRLKTVGPLLARSLAIKLNTDCFQKLPELQAACLMEGRDALVLDDGHSTSMVGQLTSGFSADLAMQLTYSPKAGGGYYSTYVAAVMDIARLLDSFHTAQYQYIPALATIRGDKLALQLNTPPSFHNPKSVLVTALPPIAPPQTPPLQPVAPNDAYCAVRPDLVLPVEGAPLVYSTRYAHHLVLRVTDKEGKPVDLPVRPDAEKGGLVLDAAGFEPDRFAESFDGALHGQWGFAPFDGPTFHLQNAHAEPWRLAADDQQALVVGREDTVHLEGRMAACVEKVTLESPTGDALAATWKAAPPEKLAVTLPLTNAEAGPMTLQVKQYGVKDPDVVQLKVFAQASHVDSLALHVGDDFVVLKGSRLDEVAGLTFAGVEFKPGALRTAGGGDELTLAAADAKALAKLRAGQAAVARITFSDGRTAKLKAAVAGPRPKTALIGKSVQLARAGAPLSVQLKSEDELPQGAQLTFSVRAEGEASFSDHLAVEVATADGAASTRLTPAGGLMLEDAHVAVATLDTAKAFSPSAFGALQFRIVQDGVTGDWQPLATLVRLPTLQAITCARGGSGPCELAGSNLFLIQSVAGDAEFEHAVKVPEGFPGHVLTVPHPIGGRLFVKLRDDPSVVNEAGVHAARATPPQAPKAAPTAAE